MNHRVQIVVGLILLFQMTVSGSEPFRLKLRHQVETGVDTGRFHRLERDESWDPSKTAIIVCDMWDSHHCYRAVQREKEFAPRLNQMLIDARSRGATIIHAPSDCMGAYQDHPARQRAIAEPVVADYPPNISTWCHSIFAEETAKYPIDQTDGGEDDTTDEHVKWQQQLKAEGRNVAAPWLRQIDAIEIDQERDFISDKGKEIWNVLRNHGIENVILAGVHTNMCVLGRPFGLRRMAMAGMNVVLVRDLTDTMYNPQAKPYVSHFSGTDLIIDHIERYVCSTMTSEQLIGGTAFRFADDKRPHVAILISEPEYQTEVTLPDFAESHLRRDYRITTVFGSATEPNSLPGIELISEADAVVVSVRRRTPPKDQLAVVRDFIAKGKPVVGIRTASHAFCLRAGDVPADASEWPEFDHDVFGGHYTNHYGVDDKPVIAMESTHANHPILSKINEKPFAASGSLYMVSPLNPQAIVLLNGNIPDHAVEPVAWTFTRADGGRSFYTSLGAAGDFKNESFQLLLNNAIRWAVESQH